MVKEKDQYYWIIYTAVEMKTHLKTVFMMELESTHVTAIKWLVFCVQMVNPCKNKAFVGKEEKALGEKAQLYIIGCQLMLH